jgi:mersacidin/lichenicidin family type 2 lantibiotic
MKKKTIIEAWRDEDYYLSLSPSERAALPEHPAGVAGVEDGALKSVTGGCSPPSYCYWCGGQGGTGMCTPCPRVACSA